MDLVVAQMNVWTISLSLALGMLAAWRIGIWMGQTARVENRGTAPSKFDDASLALLGLLLAFTFGVSISKHDQRRMAIVADSNAIGDFYTSRPCSRNLSEPSCKASFENTRNFVSASGGGSRVLPKLTPRLSTFRKCISK